MAIKNAVYKVDNGSDFDEIHFKTNADQVISKDGKTVEKALDETFKKSGGTISGGIYVMNKGSIGSSRGDKFDIASGVDLLTLYTPTQGVFISETQKSLSPRVDDQMNLGNDIARWRDLYIGRNIGTASIKTRTRWFTTYIAGRTPTSGRVILPYPLGTDRGSMIVIGGHVIKGNGVANAFTGIYYNPTTFEFDSVEAGRSYLVCIAILQE
ncbi:MAG: hypothetical protein RR620_13300 [Clostridium sp.]